MEERLVADLLKEEKTHWWHRAKRALVTQCIPPGNGKALVLGVGGGVICEELKNRGYDVTAIDLSSVSCAHVAREFGVHVMQADLEKTLAIGDSLFDLVVATDTLEHIENESQLLHEIFRSMKTSGRLIVTVPAYQSFWSSWDERLGHKRRYTGDGLGRRIKDAGFRVKKLSYFNTLICAFVYLYRKSPLYRKNTVTGKSDFSTFSGRLPSLFFNGYYFIERNMIALFNMPFGLSILTVAMKNG